MIFGMKSWKTYQLYIYRVNDIWDEKLKNLSVIYIGLMIFGMKNWKTYQLYIYRVNDIWDEQLKNLSVV